MILRIYVAVHLFHTGDEAKSDPPWSLPQKPNILVTFTRPVTHPKIQKREKLFSSKKVKKNL